MSSPSARLTIVAPSLAATHAVAGVLASLSRRGDVVVLAGEMGSGKTAFAQGFGRALGVTEPITSPTFTLVHTYEAPRIRLHHADVYRLDQLAEVADLALGELAEFDGIVLVEWGDVVSAALGEHLEVRLELFNESAECDDESAADARREEAAEAPPGRRIRIAPRGPAWAKRWSAVTAAIGALGLETAGGPSPC